MTCLGGSHGCTLVDDFDPQRDPTGSRRRLFCLINRITALGCNTTRSFFCWHAGTARGEVARIDWKTLMEGWIVSVGERRSNTHSPLPPTSVLQSLHIAAGAASQQQLRRVFLRCRAPFAAPGPVGLRHWFNITRRAGIQAPHTGRSSVSPWAATICSSWRIN